MARKAQPKIDPVTGQQIVRKPLVRTLYVFLKDDSNRNVSIDGTVVNLRDFIDSHIVDISMNGRALIQQLSAGSAKPFLVRRIAASTSDE